MTKTAAYHDIDFALGARAIGSEKGGLKQFFETLKRFFDKTHQWLSDKTAP